MFVLLFELSVCCYPEVHNYLARATSGGWSDLEASGHGLVLLKTYTLCKGRNCLLTVWLGMMPIVICIGEQENMTYLFVAFDSAAQRGRFHFAGFTNTD